MKVGAAKKCPLPFCVFGAVAAAPRGAGASAPARLANLGEAKFAKEENRLGAGASAPARLANLGEAKFAKGENRLEAGASAPARLANPAEGRFAKEELAKGKKREPSRNRTCDLLVKSQLLYRLSYRPSRDFAP